MRTTGILNVFKFNLEVDGSNLNPRLRRLKTSGNALDLASVCMHAFT